jgi:hypothetical protein
MGWLGSWGRTYKLYGPPSPANQRHVKIAKVQELMVEAAKTWQEGHNIAAWARLDYKSELGIYAAAVVDWLESCR